MTHKNPIFQKQLATRQGIIWSLKMSLSVLVR